MGTFRFAGGVAVVTGAASGIGFEFSRLAFLHGMKVVMADVDALGLDQAVDVLKVPASEVLTVQVDVSQDDEMERLALSVFERFGCVSVLINNAGVCLNKSVWEHTQQDWQWIFGVNVFAISNALRHFLPKMLNQKEGGHILNTASVAGLVNTPGLSAYSASKHAVVSMSETLYLELKESRSQLGVSVLCPAWVQTNIQNAQKNRLSRYQNPSEISSESSMRYEAQMNQAITHAKLSAGDIALCAFDAIDRNDFYILPHRKINPIIERRMQDILMQRNPFIDGGSKQ